MQGWARLNPEQRERFFQSGLKAALRLERQEFREWLMRRLDRTPARRAGRSGQLRHFEGRHGVADETIPIDGARCRWRDRAVGARPRYLWPALARITT